MEESRQASASESVEEPPLPPREADTGLNWAVVFLICTFSLLVFVESAHRVRLSMHPLRASGGAGLPARDRIEKIEREPAQVYLDIGANDGLSAMRFFGVPGLPPVKDPDMHAKVRSGKWHVVLMEASIRLREHIEWTVRDLEDMGHTVQLLNPMAISTVHGENITFFIDNWWADTHAATTVAGSKSNSGEMVSVPAVDLMHLCTEMVLGGLTEEDTVVVKIDIEGAEYDVLLGAMDQGVPALWDELYVEFHHDNEWTIKGTPMEAPSREKHAAIMREMPEKFGLKVGFWDR